MVSLIVVLCTYLSEFQISKHHSHSVSRAVASTMSTSKQKSAKCPFCSQKFKAGLNSRSELNRHLRYFSKRPEDKRKGHPAVDSIAFREIARQREFKSKVGESEQERKERKAAVNKKYRESNHEKLLQSIPDVIAKLK